VTLLYNAQALHHTTLSLIPVYGATNPARPKEPALRSWTQYQRDRADWPTIESWFSAGYQLAIVTGRLSGVVVIDFDTRSLWESFKVSPLWPLVQLHPMVESRRGYHVYIPVAASGPALFSRKGDGWDYLAEGRYAIAPGSRIDGHEYTVIHGDISTLGSPNDALAGLVLAWLLASAGNKSPSGGTDPAGTGERLSIEAARALYRTWSGKGRNHALHLVARLMRDHHYNEAAAIDALVDLHAGARSAREHQPETPAARRNEALRTIHSAYRWAPRPTKHVPIKQLPNIIREHLNQTGLTALARLLDGLRAKGIRPGSVMARGEIFSAVRGIVGDWSIRRGFEWLVSLPKTLPTTAISHSEIIDTKCFCIGGQNRLISNGYKRGRKSTSVYVPTDEILAAAIGLTLNKASDPISPAETKSAKRYRAALYREFIRRKPGTYGREMLATKHGVHQRTLRRYAGLEGICSAPTFISTPLTGTAVQGLCYGAAGSIEVYFNEAGRNRTRAVFLVDERNNRYPAIAPLAAKLIKAGHKLHIVQQRANYYWHASQSERAPAPTPLTQKPLPAPLHPKRKKTSQSKSPLFPAETSSADDNEAAFTGLYERVHQLAKQPQAKRKAARWTRTLPAHKHRLYHKPLAHGPYEYVATMIHQRWPALAMPTARRVVHLCGGQQVYRAIALTENRRNVRDEAAFFLSVVGYQHAIHKQQEEKKQYFYRVIHPRRRRRTNGDSQ
jgi:hypothetical protein